MAKICSKCGKIKELSDFHKHKGNKDGRAYACAKCSRKQHKTQKFTYICGKCGNSFINNKKRKNCFDCKPFLKIGQSKSFCHSEALKYQFRNDFKKFSYSAYSRCRTMNWLDDVCSHMQYKLNSYTFKSLKNEALKYKTRSEFSRDSNNFYQAAAVRGILDDICQHMVALHKSHSLESIKIAASQYERRIDFEKGHSRSYQAAINKGILDEVCQHMEWVGPRGFSKSDFISSCEQKGASGRTSGKGILYLIKCWNNNETFYKFGITSQKSASDRYPSRTSMPYNYKIIWQIEGDPAEIYDLEQECHRSTKLFRYQPKLWKGKSRETFNCHGNCKILRKL